MATLWIQQMVLPRFHLKKRSTIIKDHQREEKINDTWDCLWVTVFYLHVIHLLLYVFIKKMHFQAKEHVEIKRNFTTIEVGEKSSRFIELLCNVEVGEKMNM